MRYFEITSGMRLPVSKEEQDILDKVGDNGCAKSDFDERDQEVARRMVSRGLLRRITKDGKIKFKKNKESIRRD